MNKKNDVNFDNVLKEEVAAIKTVIAGMIAQGMDEKQLTKTETAKRMKISRIQLDRILDPKSHNVTLASLVKAAAVMNKKILIRFADSNTNATCQ